MKNMLHYEFDANLWQVPGKGGWHMLNLPLQLSPELKLLFTHLCAARGRLSVEVQIEDQLWQTSLLRDDSASVFLLPVKFEVRKDLKLKAGDLCTVQLKLKAP